MSNLEASPERKADLAARRKFGKLAEALHNVNNEIGQVLTVANSMRLSLAQAALTLAEIEALYVYQTHDRRKTEAKLYEVEAQLADLLENAKTNTAAVATSLAKRGEIVESLLTQAQRITDEPFIVDKDTSVVADVEYVGVEFFTTELGMSLKTVRRYIDAGHIPAHDALSTPDKGQPAHQWIKSKAVETVAAIRKAAPAKKGIAALV